MTAVSSVVEEARQPATARARARVRTETKDGIAVVLLDDAAATQNTITPELGEELIASLDAVIADASVRAVVVASAKPAGFLAGANVESLRGIRFAEDASAKAKRLAASFQRVARSEKPFVALVHGPALGGGFELALACTHIVATDDPRTVVGLPEVRLGLIPAANGLLRVAERAGIAVALDLGLSGRSIAAARARSLGLVDEIVAPSIALEAARRVAKKLAEKPKRRFLPRVSPSFVQRFFLDQTRMGRTLLARRARARMEGRTHGHYPAPEAILEVLERFGARGFSAAAELEAKRFGELVVGETAHRLVELFQAHTSAKKDTGLDNGETAAAARVERMVVVGAGLIGAGITAVSAERGVVVRLKERDDDALGRGIRYVQDHLHTRARGGHLTRLERARALTRITTATAFTGMRTADLVVEAVYEDLTLKHAVVRDLEAIVREECVIASSTASLPIARIAESARHPERILGMHYFAPVTKVPLVEVVRGPATSARALATAVALGRRQGKTVIVVKDGAGFYTTRTLAPFLHEALRLVEEGVPVDVVDEALVEWGFPLGPLHLFDELGIDLAGHVAGLLQTAFGDRLRAPKALSALRLDDRKGRKNGRGFYLYGRGARAEKRVDDTVYTALGIDPQRPRASAPPRREEIQARCALALVNEALRCLDEGVLRTARDGDLGAVLGLGFPAFRGGPFRYVDVLGAAEVLKRTRALEQRLGDRFTPAPLLVEAARRGRRFWST